MPDTVVPSDVFTIEVDGEPVEARPGQTVAAAMLAAGLDFFRNSTVDEEPRSAFCLMGTCWECAVEINGRPDVRACQTEVRPGMKIRTNRTERSETNE
jgi:predicted molibdopterin-dependent oxidoreductase YjgC